MPSFGSSSSITFQLEGMNAQSPATASKTFGFSSMADQIGFVRTR